MSNGDDTEFGYGMDDGDQPEESGMIREGDAAGRSPFDPTPYMRQLRGRGGNQDYLDVKWRLLWLRREHPDAEILTEHVRIDEGMAIFKATVSVPTGGKATGYGSETAGDFGDFIEKAETKAIGRALNALGYGAQFSEKGDEEAPVPPARPAERPSPPHPSRTEAAPSPQSATAPSPPRPVAPAPPPPESSPAPQSRPEPPEPMQLHPAASDTAAPPKPPARATAPASAAASGGDAGGDDVDMADINWTAFWAWARPLGYSKRGDVEAFLGHSIADLTPGEVRVQIRAARGEE